MIIIIIINDLAKSIKSKSVKYSEIDSIIENGFYTVTETPGLLFHITWDVNFMSQIRSSLGGLLYYRIKTGGTWGEWYQLGRSFELNNIINGTTAVTKATSATYSSTSNYAKAIPSHNHNDLYYTKSQTNTSISDYTLQRFKDMSQIYHGIIPGTQTHIDVQLEQNCIYLVSYMIDIDKTIQYPGLMIIAVGEDKVYTIDDIYGDRSNVFNSVATSGTLVGFYQKSGHYVHISITKIY